SGSGGAALYYYRDRHPEPWGLVTLAFFLGTAACVFVYPLQRWAQKQLGPEPTSSGELFLECLLVPGLIEEAVKLIVTLLVVWRNEEFDEPVDGLIYGIAVALGFTFGEDLRYYLRHGADGTRLLTTLAHPWFSSFWASSVGWTLVLGRWQGPGL